MASIDWTDICKKYKGLWVALLDDQQTVVGSGRTLKEAKEEAQKNGHKSPIMMRVPERIIPFVGTSNLKSELDFWDYLSDEALAKSGM